MGVAIVVETNPLYQTVSKAEKKIRKEKNRQNRVALCEQNKMFCGNSEVCSALGYCMLKHPLVTKMYHDQLKRPRPVNSVLKIFTRLITESQGKEDAQLFREMILSKIRPKLTKEAPKGNCKKNFRSSNCTNHKVCDLLGQCMKDHPLIRDNEDLKERLSGEFISTRQCVKVFEELMPSLKRMNNRRFFKPEIEIREEL